MTTWTESPAASTAPLRAERASLAGLGWAVPDRVLGNEELSRMVETTDEWIVERTGIRERHIVAKDEATSDLALRAARRALEEAGVEPEAVGLIIVGTITPDHVFPSTACLVQRDLGAWNAGAFDVSAACSGFIYALAVGQKFVESGSHANVLVIGADTLSSITDYRDRNTCVLFGDAAGAALLQPSRGRREVLGTCLAARGEDRLMVVPAGGSRLPANHETVDARLHYMHINGREVFKFAVKTMRELIGRALADHGFTPDDVCLVVPHQVNRRIIEAAVKKLEIDPARVYVNIDRYGNTSAASVPLALAEADARGRLEPGKLVLLCAFGAGLTWGYALLRA